MRSDRFQKIRVAVSIRLDNNLLCFELIGETPHEGSSANLIDSFEDSFVEWESDLTLPLWPKASGVLEIVIF